MKRKFSFFLANSKTEELESCDSEIAFDFPKTYFIAKHFFGKEKTLSRFRKELILCDCKFLLDYVSLDDIEEVILKETGPETYVFTDENDEYAEKCWLVNIENIYFKSLNTMVDPHI